MGSHLPCFSTTYFSLKQNIGMSELAKKINDPIKESVLSSTFSHLVVHKEDIKPITSAIYHDDQQSGLPCDYKDKLIKELRAKNLEQKKYIESNLELENFAYIASHDLKAPLRTVMSFSQLLQKNHYGFLDDKGKQYLDIISTASQDMICLIDDLLKYSEITSTDIVVSQSDVNSILKTVLIDMQPFFDEAEATVTYTDMPRSLKVDKQRMYQLFKHLLDNSIKFRREDVALKINIHAEELKDHWLFKVSDNGTGIPSQFSEKAFELFKKHKTNDNRKGTGVGLTLSKAIVRHHDGKIWVEANQDGGNVTCFMISKELDS